MSDFHATERIIGGFIVVGIASLLSWNHSQSGDPGMLGTLLVGAMVGGGLWAAAGLFELFARPQRSGPAGPAQASDQTTS